MYNKILIIISGLIQLSVYSQEIRSIQLKAKNTKEQISIVPLGNILELSFDDLNEEEKEYQYKIEHMTYNWKPSNLISSQYINGYQQNYINNITSSFNSLQKYTHYTVNIPNKNSVITKSGNYLISVLDDYDNVVFSRKCVFTENLTTVGVSVTRSSILNSIDKQQNVKVIINYNDLKINNPQQEIKTVILQNYNWKSSKYNDSPQFYKPQQLIYGFKNKNNFLAGNEFRNFDTKTIRNTNVNVAHVEMKEIFHSYLYTDIPKKNKPYSYNPDINGQFVLRSIDSNDTNTEGDYSIIHFSLKSEKLSNKEVYVTGLFNNYTLSEENKMTYNSSSNKYEVEIKLKQGFYNYQYTTLNKKREKDHTFFDGSFYATENIYTALIYYKPFGSQYDRVIGLGNGFFNQNN